MFQLFNPNNPKTLRIIKQTLENVKTYDGMGNVLKKVKFITYKRHAPNLGRIFYVRIFFHSVTHIWE